MIEKKIIHQNFFSGLKYYGKWVVFNEILIHQGWKSIIY